jgi:hypothetical protein
MHFNSVEFKTYTHDTYINFQHIVISMRKLHYLIICFVCVCVFLTRICFVFELVLLVILHAELPRTYSAKTQFYFFQLATFQL